MHVKGKKGIALCLGMFIMGSAFLTGCGKGGEAGNSAGSDPQPLPRV